MKVSEARLAANRANAAKSTGPKTAEGKAVSRLNAFRHGMAGQGDLLGPGEDAAAIDALAAEFAHDYAASGKSGRMLARRAAVLSIRMERLAERQMAAVAVNVAAAQAQFDDDRRDWLDDEIERVAAGGDEARVALEVLETVPEGVLHRLDTGEAIFDDLTHPDPAVVVAATERAERWLQLKDGTAGPVINRVRAELIRLDALFQTMGAAIDAIAADRNRAGSLARFDATPEALLAQRDEAAAERGMHRALKAIVTQNRERRRAMRDDDPDADCATTMAAARELLTRATSSTRTEFGPTPTPEFTAVRSPRPLVRRPARPQPLVPMGSFGAAQPDRSERFADPLDADADLDPMVLPPFQGCPDLLASLIRG